MTKKIEETGLTTKCQEDTEFSQISQASLTSQAITEVQGALILAKRFPRDEDAAYEKLLKACRRYLFADKANYSFPRGGATITGPSINLAREFARVWGNIEYGHIIVSDDEEERHIRAWAWDKETNARVFEEDSFKKLIYRKKEGWIKPDERDLRELTNRRAAICKRNCLLQLMPRDYIEDAQHICKMTIQKKIVEDPDRAKKDIILAFSTLNVTPAMLEEYLKHPIAQCSPAEIVTLREIYQSISDGNSKWSEYLNGNGEEKKTEGQLSLDALKNGKVDKPKNGDEESKIDVMLQEWFETYNFNFDKAKENLSIKKDWRKLPFDQKKALLEEVKRVSLEQ